MHITSHILFMGVENKFGGSCLRYYAYHKMIKMVFVWFFGWGQLPPRSLWLRASAKMAQMFRKF